MTAPRPNRLASRRPRAWPRRAVGTGEVMGISRSRTLGTSARWIVACLISLVMPLTPAAQAGSDRPPLETLLAEARIAVPPTPFPAPSVSVRDVAGGTVDLAGLRGRVVLLYFWTTW